MAVQEFQVSYELNEENKQREFDGLLEAVKKFNLSEGLILTFDQEDKFTIDGKQIIAKPVWKWMIEHDTELELERPLSIEYTFLALINCFLNE